MDTSLIGAMAAVFGSLVGGSATIATTWIGQRISTKREQLSEELRKRETLYGEFISECSKLAVDSLAHGIEMPEKMWSAYALLNRIRLSASPAVLEEADAVLKRIAEQYFAPNLSLEDFHAIVRSHEGDPLEALGHACRDELDMIREAIRSRTGVFQMDAKLDRSHLPMRKGSQHQNPG